MVEIKPATGTATVTVYSKLPMGLRCVLHAKRELREATMGGFRDVTQSFPTEREFLIKGNAHGQNEGPRVRIVAGFAVTEGIPKELWDVWAEQNKELPALKSGMIIAYENSNKGADAAKENRKVKTGLERIDPNNPTQINAGFKIETAKEQIVKPVVTEDA